MNVRIEHLFRTAKQRAFDSDFLASWADHVTWKDAPMHDLVRLDGVFGVEEEDVVAYNLALGETHPLMIDPEYARQHRGSVIVHPVFITAIAFWLARPGTPASWIRTPGARNPFQRIEIVDRIEVGDRISADHQNVDRFIRRGNHYLTARFSLRDERDQLKAECYATLILPPDGADVERFAKA